MRSRPVSLPSPRSACLCAEERAQAEEAKALAAAAEERRKRDEEEAAKPKGMFQKLFGLK
jgi:hypothetical protein